jgi:hypothetical protein
VTIVSKVFISYSSKDREFVERLVRDLDAADVDTFYDQRIKPGDSWAESLARAVESAEFLLVVLSPDSVSSKWVEQEVRIGLTREADGQAHVIPLLLHPCEIPPLLADKTYASFDQDYQTGLSRILAVLKGQAPQPKGATASNPEDVVRLKNEVAQFKAEQSTHMERTLIEPLKRERKRCFIVMPFGNEDLQVVYEDFVKPVLEEECSLEVERG